MKVSIPATASLISTTSLDCYINGALQFECSDVIETESNVLLVVLANSNPSATVCYCKSTDQGKSWNSPALMNIPNPNQYQLLYFNLLKLANNIIYIITCHIVNIEDNSGIPLFSESHDNGKTWSELTMLNFFPPLPPEEYMIIISSRNITQTTNGRIVIPVASQTNRTRIYSIYQDRGKSTWHCSKELPKKLGSVGGFSEPTIAQLKDGRLIMLIGTQLGYIYQSYSEDEGQTWSQAKPTTLQSPWTAHALRITKEGYLIVAFTNDPPDSPGSGYPRTNITTAVSYDEGKTWNEEQFSTIAISDMIMEPSLTLFDNNTKILISFSQNDPHTKPGRDMYPNNLSIQVQVYDRKELIRRFL